MAGMAVGEELLEMVAATLLLGLGGVGGPEVLPILLCIARQRNRPSEQHSANWGEASDLFLDPLRCIQRLRPSRPNWWYREGVAAAGCLVSQR